jgi:hypothetical protein
MYKDLIGEAAAGGAGPPALGGAPKNVGSALGAPEATGVGAFPKATGDALSPRAAASATIDQLAGLKSHFPSGADRIDGMIAEITGMAKDGLPEPSAGALAPPPPIAAVPPPLPATPPATPPGPPLPLPTLAGAGAPPMGGPGALPLPSM